MKLKCEICGDNLKGLGPLGHYACKSCRITTACSFCIKIHNFEQHPVKLKKVSARKGKKYEKNAGRLK